MAHVPTNTILIPSSFVKGESDLSADTNLRTYFYHLINIYMADRAHTLHAQTQIDITNIVTKYGALGHDN